MKKCISEEQAHDSTGKKRCHLLKIVIILMIAYLFVSKLSNPTYPLMLINILDV